MARIQIVTYIFLTKSSRFGKDISHLPTRVRLPLVLITGVSAIASGLSTHFC